MDIMDIIEKYKKSILESALNEFGEKYADFCNNHTCATCVLAPDPVPFLSWRQQCKANVIDHLTEANKKMDEAIAKAEEVKRKKHEYAEKLLLAIKAEKRDLEYRNRRDAEYIVLNPDDEKLLQTVSGYVMCCRIGEPGYSELFGMRVLVNHAIKRGEFVIGFKTDSHIKEVTE